MQPTEGCGGPALTCSYLCDRHMLPRKRHGHGPQGQRAIQTEHRSAGRRRHDHGACSRSSFDLLLSWLERQGDNCRRPGRQVQHRNRLCSLIMTLLHRRSPLPSLILNPNPNSKVESPTAGRPRRRGAGVLSGGQHSARRASRRQPLHQAADHRSIGVLACVCPPQQSGSASPRLRQAAG